MYCGLWSGSTPHTVHSAQQTCGGERGRQCRDPLVERGSQRGLVRTRCGWRELHPYRISNFPTSPKKVNGAKYKHCAHCIRNFPASPKERKQCKYKKLNASETVKRTSQKKESASTHPSHNHRTAPLRTSPHSHHTHHIYFHSTEDSKRSKVHKRTAPDATRTWL
jgi:hypothetical protein